MSDDSSHNFHRRTFLKATGVAGAAAATSGLAAATPGREPGPKEDEVLVGVSAGRGDVEQTVAQYVPGDAEVVHKNDKLRYVAVKFPSANSTAQQNFIEAITKKDGIKYAEVNATHSTFYDSNDPQETDQYSIEQVQSEEAWDTTMGDSNVTIAVVDQGAQYDHEDLAGNYKSDPGYDFVDSDSDPYPDDTSSEDHGTHVSGCAAAVVDNGTGIAGQGNSSLINGRALSEDGSGSTSDIADAVEWAADQGADIINMSLGGGGYTDTMKNAVSYAHDNGVALFCAAGNDYGSAVSYPAAYSECIAISAVNDSEGIADFSNVGSEVELAAPGVDILSTVPVDSYTTMSGTSMATPVTSGVAGLTLAQWDLTNSELRNHLKGTAKDIGLSSDEQGCGQVNAYNAVTTDPTNRSSDCAASSDGGDDGDDGGDGGSGDSTSTTVSDSLSDYTDYDCWSWTWEYTDPSQIVVELDGPSDADFDLYTSEGETDCPGPYDYDQRSYTVDSQESITIDNPDTSTDLQICVDSYDGSGSYDLTITEYQ